MRKKLVQWGMLEAADTMVGRLRPMLAGIVGLALGVATPAANIAAEPAAEACRRARPLRVAIDIGHSPKQWGATSARGRHEYDFNSRFARELVDMARGVEGLRVFVLDSDARRIEVRDRPVHAAERKADVFLSIHHDFVNRRYLKNWFFGDRHLKYADDFSGHSLFVSRSNGNFEGSVWLGRMLGEKLLAAGFLPTLHHAEKIPGENRELLDRRLGLYEAPFAVLRLSAMPAVLLEVGVLANRAEELKLEDLSYRRRIEQAVLAGLAAYCNNKHDEGTAAGETRK